MAKRSAKHASKTDSSDKSSGSPNESSDRSPDRAAADVVAFAKSQGIDISYVHEEVNRLAAERQKAAAAAAEKAAQRPSTPASKKKASSNPTKKVSKTAYVLSLPHLSANEIVAKAKGEGIVLTNQYVYNIRSLNGSKAPKNRPTSLPVQSAVEASRAPRVVPAPAHTDSASQLIHAALDMGLAQAEALLKEVRKKLTSM